MKIFADDTKVLGNIRPEFAEKDSQIVQQDLKNISNWCKDWSIYPNSEKFKVIRIGIRAAYNQYTIIDPSNDLSQNIETSNSERDLGVIISHNLKPRNQVQKVSPKVNAVLALLRNNFISKNHLREEAIYHLCKITSGISYTY